MALLAVHADWSVDPAKRWMTVAHGTGQKFVLAAPVPVGDPATLFARLLALAENAAVAFGIDAPLGVPRAWAACRPEADFCAFLAGLAPNDPFFQVAATLGEITQARPFYPARGVRGMRQAEHAAALGFADSFGLRRACDRATDLRPAGAPLFWTLGANQTGKAALSLWRDMLIGPRPGSPLYKIWPFAGDFLHILAPGTVTVAETYPAECMRALGISTAGSKRRQADRAAAAPSIKAAMARLDAHADASLTAAITAGFGADAAGEDRFDSVLGVLGVVAVLRGVLPDRPPHLPIDPWVTRWEGWVLGQRALPRVAPQDQPPGSPPAPPL